MNRFSNIDEKRQSFRYPVFGERQEGELRFGKKRFNVRLIDESAGGFGAVCEQAPDIQVGAKGLLLVGEDWFEVSVSNFRTLETTSSDEKVAESSLAKFSISFTCEAVADPVEYTWEPEPMPPLTGCRLGLRRLERAFNSHDLPPFYSWAGLSCRLKHVNRGILGAFALGIFLAMTAAFIPYSSMKLSSANRLDASINEKLQWLQQVKPANAKIANLFHQLTSLIGSNNNSATESSLSSMSREQLAELRQTIRRLPGAMPFVLPEVARELQLTESQQKQIQELIVSSTELLKNIDTPSSGASSKDEDRMAEELFNRTRTDALKLLDSNQKKIWNQLIGESENNSQ